MRFASRQRRNEKLLPVLPTLLTLGNVICGFGSITFAAKIGPVVLAEPDPLGENTLLLPALLILAAMVFDTLDGFVARRANQITDFGGQLDSLCDVISFGLAPAFLMLKFPHAYSPRIQWMIATLFLVCAALRLARFNVETDDSDRHESFVGLPTPAAAGVIASFAIVMPTLQELADPLISPATHAIAAWLVSITIAALPLITIALACLMVSQIRYPHMINQLFHTRHQFSHMVQLVFVIMVVLAVHELAIPLLLCCFAVASPLRALGRKLLTLTPGRSPHASR